MIQRQGGFIPGIRPGRRNRQVPGAHPQPDHPARFAVPGGGGGAAVDRRSRLRNIPLGFSGISILIVVGVALETMKQIESQLMMRNYEGFLS